MPDTSFGSDEKLGLFLETVPLGIFVSDAAGRPYYANAKAQELLGRKISGSSGATRITEIFKAYRAGTDQKYPTEEIPLMRALSGETATVNDMEIRKPGKSIYLEMTGYPIYDENGALSYAVAALVDITQLKETDAYHVEYIRKLEEFASRLMTTEEKLQQSYGATMHIIETAPLGIVLVNEDGGVSYVNKAMLDISGTGEQEFKKVNLLEVPTYKEKGIDALIRDVFKGNSFTTQEIEYRSFIGNKTTIRRFSGIPFGEGSERNALIFVEDLTEQKKAEKVLFEAKQDWENTFNSINDMITIHDSDYNILNANSAAKATLGLDLSAVGKVKCYEYFHKSAEPPKECPMVGCLLTGKYTVSEIFDRHLNKFIEVRVTPRFDARGSMSGVIHVVRDITERKKLEQELTHQALYDALTNLPNRILLRDRIQNLYDHKKREENLLFAVLFIDLDEFKKINDSLGHLMGDELLLSVAVRLSECIRPGDTISRFGGDEFVILLDDLAGPEDAVSVAERIYESLSSVFSLNGQEVFISASIGIALSDMSSDRPEDLLRNADIAMYHAKTAGKARYALFDRSMYAAVVDSLAMENDLRRALPKGELTVFYQPIVDIQSKRVVGFEALARWLHPVQGFIPPAKFIPAAESTGLIEPIGAMVLKTACAGIHALNALSPRNASLYVSVNLSAKQFNKRLPHLVSSILAESGLESRNLRLEVTEGTIMENMFVASSILHELKALGIQVYLDDFGTGYSSLNYLHKFPVNALKIDPSFTKNIRNDKQAQEILKSIQGLANNLDMKMIIEGVEDQEQLTTFKDLNCRFIQGYLYSKPLPMAELTSFMRESEGFVARVTDNSGRQSE